MFQLTYCHCHIQKIYLYLCIYISLYLYLYIYIYFKTSLLEYPNKTQCFDHRSKGLSSKGHCFDICLLNSSRVNGLYVKNMFTILYPGPNTINSMTTDVKCIKSNTESNVQYSKRCNLMLRQSCFDICKIFDCVEERFNLVFYNTFNQSIAQVILLSPTHPSTVIK